ncbi:beta-alanine-activating enzyme [Aplochiton taeniatus]
MVAKAASMNSSRIAVTFDSGTLSGSSISLNYSELTALANELTLFLRKGCMQSNGMIALFCHMDVNLPVWIIGILQLPAAYVPLDPDAPALVSVRIIARSGLRYCLLQSYLLEEFQTACSNLISVEVCAVMSSLNLTLLRVHHLPAAVQRFVATYGVQTGPEGKHRDKTTDHLSASDRVAEKAAQENLAYVLHTSGTTGDPKIVRVPHKCIVSNILHLRLLFQMSVDDVIFLAAPLTFDPSVVEIFLALSSGAQLLIVPNILKKMPNRLAGVLFNHHRVTVLQVTPTLLGRFGVHILQEKVLSASSSLRVLALGGEACPSLAILRSWRQKGNCTQMYNIYGITEVSCWACCYKVPESVLQSNQYPAESSVPLGTPLMGTTVEIRAENNDVVSEGEGQVFIGGKDRGCLLDDEVTVMPGMMRATGDWVQVRDTHLYYLGRRDRLIKRHGQRVHLDTLQQVVMSLNQVQCCAVGLYEGARLVAFIVPSTSEVPKGTLILPSARHQSDPSTSASSDDQESLAPYHTDHRETNDMSNKGLERAIIQRLSKLLPSYSMPDTLVLVPALPLTSHGKVSMGELMKIYQRQRENAGSHASLGDLEALKERLQLFWRDTLGLAEDTAIGEESKFLFSGGDSLKAIHLCDDIITALRLSPSSGLLEVVLDGTFSDVVRHVATATMTLPSDSSEVIARTDPPAGASEHGITHSNAPLESLALELKLSWSSDTGRCVDASPVLLVQRGTEQDWTSTTVFIGSHSQRMQALDLASGGLRWERVLGDRIESSAAISQCGTLVVVGCYDGSLYFLCVDSGETWWTFKTEDAVKSCPAVDCRTGLVMVGSHDGRIYALDPQARECVWQHHCGAGAVFSSPSLHPSLRQLYVATLGGTLLCLSPDSGEVLWTYCRQTPFFSSPSCSSSNVVIGSVDGHICCFSHTGELLWQYKTKGPVFSSPCFTPNQQRVVCGSHDGFVYCLDCADGSLVWCFQTTSRVYSSPYLFDGSPWGHRGSLVALASTDGTLWILDGESGTRKTSLSLPGELFSSPVVWKHFLVVGCRNDFVYCIKLVHSGETQTSS